MEILGTTRLIALLGDPVAHSLSPAMHNPAFEHYGLDFAYVPLRVSAENLKTALDALRAFNFRGANVTLPHKQAVIPFLDQVTDISRQIGAVNSILNEDGRLIGTTTDPEGFLEGYREKGRFTQPERRKENSWAHPVVVGGKLYLRDQDLLLCYDIQAQ